ncbi:2-amino-4-hydroxy-6-hydroxymethyldihydropteridine diphosphokinase [Halosquirtibacter laminarini]|uniref:2-amino-4-hydroxy-6-hydroxymethyldihydropteridine diphosphokinase n=1 Tax=Halosquirtibacter laminarini TaxID=3374600 RepID=A0AC61NLY1_9BACT|nr:2-amino-4-hydroxy-6-hydroxymethyldihydropteridine diphosphokinase [Prolixibacteraceae bacterium]
MNFVFIGLGGNQGEMISNLENAKYHLKKVVGRIIKTSPLYESEPWGFESDTNFINCVVKIETILSAEQVLHSALEIEAELGRLRKGKGYASRPMDIDIIDFNGSVLDDYPILVLPHPRMHLRKFVLLPLQDIEPKWLHPKSKKTINELLIESGDDTQIKKVK